MKKFFLALVLIFNVLLVSCQTSSKSSGNLDDVSKSTLRPSEQLSQYFSNQFLLKAYLSLTMKKEISYNGKIREYIDLDYIDTIINDEYILSEEQISVLKTKLDVLEKWCNYYVYIEVKLLKCNDNVFLEDFVLTSLKDTHFRAKYLLEGQTTESLSFSQGKLIFLDFINYLTLLEEEDSKMILKELDNFCNTKVGSN